MKFRTTADRLAYHASRAQDLRDSARGSGDEADHIALKAWQTQRLGSSYYALSATPRFRPAVDFFLTELYAPRDFSQRDEELARVLPLMVRFLPDRALNTLADACEMDALSESLDAAMVDALRAAGNQQRINGRTYAEAYRTSGRFDERRLQIELVERIGSTLDHLTRVPLLQQTLRVMRKPAHLAGLGTLQHFLETGFAAFKHMGSARDFLDTIATIENGFMNRIVAGGNATPE
jgi:hypothetical protein